MNKKGMSAFGWMVVLIFGYLILAQMGVAPKFWETTPEEENPEVGLESMTMNLYFEDELSTTTSPVNASWYCFKSTGEYFDKGIAGSDGADVMNAKKNTGYECWAYKSGNSGYLAKKFSITTGSEPQDGATISLVKTSGINVGSVLDVLDSNSAISNNAGVQSIKISYSANTSNAGVGKPVVVLDLNGTAAINAVYTGTDNKGSSYTEISCPSRLTPQKAGRVLYCFQRDADALTNDGTIAATFSLSLTTTPPGDNDMVNATVIDTGMYLEPGFTTINGVQFGQENLANNDIGASDDRWRHATFNG